MAWGNMENHMNHHEQEIFFSRVLVQFHLKSNFSQRGILITDPEKAKRQILR